MINQGHIHIAGGGLAGTLLAVALGKRGHHVELFESREDLRSSRAEGGRSINLAISRRGLEALDRVDLLHEVLPLTIPMRGRLIHDASGATRMQPYSSNPDEFIRSVSRAELNRALLNAAGDLGHVGLHFQSPIMDVDCSAPRIQLSAGADVTESNAAGVKVSSLKTPDVLFGADGAGSAVRAALQKQVGLSASSELLPHGYKELTLDAGALGNPLLEREALHIWPRGGFMLIALPNLDNSFTCTLFMPMEGEISFKALREKDAIGEFLVEHFPDIYALWIEPEEQFLTNPTGILGTVRCSPWHGGSNVCLIGDAAHAIVPFFGQGMNCAFEDCTVFSEIIDREPNTWAEAIAQFSETRIPDANAIADMALENYVEMRASVVDARYLLKRDLAFELEERYPDRFIPRYSMVSFHTIPYAQVQKRGRIQQQILNSLAEQSGTADGVDWDRAGDMVLNQLPPLDARGPQPGR